MLLSEAGASLGAGETSACPFSVQRVPRGVAEVVSSATRIRPAMPAERDSRIESLPACRPAAGCAGAVAAEERVELQEHKATTGPNLVEGQLDELEQVPRLQMLDDLSGIMSDQRRSKGLEDLRLGRLTWPWAWLERKPRFPSALTARPRRMRFARCRLAQSRWS